MATSMVSIQPSGGPSPPSRRLTRRARVEPASLFHPQDPSLSPEDHFPLQTVYSPDRTPFPRFINRFDSREILLAVSGSCINNGRHADKQKPPAGGCSFIFKGGNSTARGWSIPVSFPLSAGTTTPTTTSNAHNPPRTGASSSFSSDPNPSSASPPPPPPLAAPTPGTVAFPLETHGPSGEHAEATSNRAKLLAVIAALQFRAWASEGWRRVVVLTDLEYIVWGATRWLPRWVARRWRKPPSSWSFHTSSASSSSSSSSSGEGEGKGKGSRYYENRDLWEELQGCVEELRGEGCEVSFWLVTGKEGSEGEGGIEGVVRQAKVAAQRAARKADAGTVERSTKLYGVMV